MKTKRKAPEPQTPAPGPRTQLVLFEGIEIRLRKRGRKERPAPDPTKPFAYERAIDRLIADPDLIRDPEIRGGVLSLLQALDRRGYGRSRARLQPGIEREPLAGVASFLGSCLGLLECEAYDNPADFGLKLRSVRSEVLACLVNVCLTIRERVEDSSHGDPEADPVPGPLSRKTHRSHARLSRKRPK